jgi:hypothetical protein
MVIIFIFVYLFNKRNFLYYNKKGSKLKKSFQVKINIKKNPKKPFGFEIRFNSLGVVKY